MTLSLNQHKLILPVIWPTAEMKEAEYFARDFNSHEARRLIDSIDTVRKFNTEQGGHYEMTLFEEPGGYFAGTADTQDGTTQPIPVQSTELVVNKYGVRWQSTARVYITTRLVTVAQLGTWIKSGRKRIRRRSA